MKKSYIIFLSLILLIAVSGMVYAQSHATLPENVQQMFAYNLEQARTITFLIAFLGGVFSLLSPCVLPILPAFFAYTFKEKKEITKMTLVFFSGASLVFILMGLTATFIGKILENYRNQIIVMAGTLLVLFGIMTIMGKGFTFVKLKSRKTGKNVWGIFTFGVLFAIGFSPCIGPVLAGILLLAAVIPNYIHSALLLFSYSLGLLLPLFILAFFFDKYKLTEKSWIKGKDFKLVGMNLNSNKIIAGLLLIIIGAVFIVYKGTAIVNSIDPLKTKIFFYTTNDFLLSLGITKTVGNLLGLAVIAGIIYWTWRFIHKKRKK